MNRLASLIDTSRAEIEKKVRIIDNDQSEFFKTVYRKKSIDKEEFDLIINRDFLGDAKNVAQIIACAYEHRFQN